MTVIISLILALSTPCEAEDAVTCYWNAEQQGNGEGQSFIDVGGTTYYLDQ